MEKDYRFFARQKGFSQKFNPRQFNAGKPPFNNKKLPFQKNKNQPVVSKTTSELSKSEDANPSNKKLSASG